MLGGVEEDIKVDEGNACLPIPTRRTNSSSAPVATHSRAAIGTSHGAYKFKGRQSLHFEVPGKRSRRRFPASPRHARQLQRAEGGSRRINAAGGTIDPAWAWM